MAHQLINFDLSTAMLKKINPDNYRRIYGEISIFMKNNGFSHKQYSGYMSIKPMSYAKALAIMEKLIIEKPYFADVAKSCIISNANPALYEIKPYLNQLASEIRQIKKTKPKLVPKNKDTKTKTNNLSR